MRRTLLTALLAMTLLSTGAAIAQVEIGTIGKPPKDLYYWRDEKGEIRFSLKRFQGRVVVFYFWRTSRAESVDYLKTLNVLEKRMHPKGVRFISMCTDIPEVVDKFVQEKGIEVFPGDKDIYNYYGDFIRYVQIAFGSMSHPECVIVDPYSNIVWRGHPGDRLEERLDEVIEATKPLAGDPKAIEALFRKADKFMDEKDYGKAYTIARRVFMATNEDSQENTKARNVMERVEEKGGDWLKEARDIKEKDKEKAAYIVAQLAVRLEDPDKELKRAKQGGRTDQQPQDENDKETGLIRDVNNAIGDLFGDRTMKALIRTAMDNARGEMLIEQAQLYEDVNRYDDARVCYKQVMDKYKETPAAKDAEAAVEKIRTDKKLKQTLQKERAADEARRWLDLGERFEKAEMPELAREQYEKVIKQHSKTEFAKTAKERLEKLPKADKKGDEAKSEKGKDEKTAAADGKKP